MAELSKAEVIAAQGPDANVMPIMSNQPHVLVEWPMDEIYRGDRPADPLSGLYEPEIAIKLAEDLQAGVIRWQDVTPVVLDAMALGLADGHHRFAAFQLAGQTHIMAFVPKTLSEKVAR